MAATSTDSGEAVDLDQRSVSALTEYMTVLPDGPGVKGARGMYLVVSQSGSEYIVDVEEGRCECPDCRIKHNTCKHQRRVEFALGEREIPAWVNTDQVDDQLGEHVQ